MKADELKTQMQAEQGEGKPPGEPLLLVRGSAGASPSRRFPHPRLSAFICGP